jgi:hypothetical protein
VATVRFSKKRAHQVYKLKSGKVVPGGSTVAKVGESSEFLLNWYYRLGTEGLDPKAVTAEASGIGTVGHGLIQCHFNGDISNFDEFSKTEYEGGLLMYEKFQKVWAEQGMEFVASEVQLVSEEHGYGGTLDIVAKKNGALVLADVKSSPRIYGHMYRQVAGYEYLWNENNPQKIDKRVIIRLDKVDPEATDVRWMGDMSKHFNVFLKQLALYQAFKDV